MRRAALAACALVLVRAVAAHAAGAIEVNGKGMPFRWATSPILYSPDRGRLGSFDNAAATAFVASTFATWEAVPSASIRFASAGPLPVDVKAGNYANFLGVCDGISPIIFDDDGSITDDLLGAGAKNVILGFSSPECGDPNSAVITESVAVLNGRFVDGIDTAANPEMPSADFGAVFLHEFGHFFNLDHTQINLREAFDDSTSDDDAVATMFPILIDGAQQGSLALDDIASVSALYPAPDLASATGSIHGRVLRKDGTGFQGAFVVARNLADPRHLAVGVVSGARYAPLQEGGPAPESLRGQYDIVGLPPGSYSLEIEQIDARFTGGSSIGPLDPPATLPGPPEWWNGPSEAATSPPDDPDSMTPIQVAAGASIDGIDVILNEPTVPNDECTAPLEVPGVPYADTEPASVATTGGDDQFQTCTADGPSKNLASLWYRLKAPRAGRYVVETSASDYDTVLTAWNGDCGSLVERACNDDQTSTVQSRVDLDLTAGESVLIEVTAYRNTTARTLRIAFRFGCVGDETTCDDGDPCTLDDACRQGICHGPTATCDDANPCTADVCDPTGACSHQASTTSCDDGDACTVGDRCIDAGCRSGARIDAAGLAASLEAVLPIPCGVERPRVRRALGHRFARASVQVERAVARRGASQARAFQRVRRLLGGLDRTAKRLRRRGGVACGDAIGMRIDTARAQLECVATDVALAPP